MIGEIAVLKDRPHKVFEFEGEAASEEAFLTNLKSAADSVAAFRLTQVPESPVEGRVGVVLWFYDWGKTKEEILQNFIKLLNKKDVPGAYSAVASAKGFHGRVVLVRDMEAEDEKEARLLT